ncbi:MAG: squalene synthase HpnC [Boseongicola sp. SB0673_bin_14]|nr:squalene synthase HpnC [Boseongicola sp. SB0667_bin_21]MYI70348.1 squalene synthase HpnC [Boseongicola sp. SB0673_bin_14]
MLLPARLRPHVATFYEFARTIDDIADSPNLTAGEKTERLEGFERELRHAEGRPGYEKATRMAASLAETGVSDIHCRNLVRYCLQDATKNRYATWQDVIDYCMLSAAPVGRYLIDLHGGSNAGYGSSDALCNALQVINHLQDFGDDYRTLDRIYLPADWMSESGVTVEELGKDRTSERLRVVIDKCLAEIEALMRDARQLPGQIKHRRLKLEAAVIVRLADRLAWQLSRKDPLAARVKLTRPEAAMCAMRGLAGGLFLSR